jgi:hypothetical protein
LFKIHQSSLLVDLNDIILIICTYKRYFFNKQIVCQYNRNGNLNKSDLVIFKKRYLFALLPDRQNKNVFLKIASHVSNYLYSVPEVSKLAV